MPIYLYFLEIELFGSWPLELAEALLSDDERKRYQGMSNAHRRREFAWGRFLARQSLAQHFPHPAERWRFFVEANGRPVLLPVEDARPQVSLAHAGELIACALELEPGEPPGVDVEDLRRELDLRALSKRFFSSQEAARLERISGEEARRALFFDLWTLKEARAKSLGVPLAESLAQPVSSGFVYELEGRWRVACTEAVREAHWLGRCSVHCPDARLRPAALLARPR
ncbi:MAG: 4'-phosphopantetheinyl transferase superfamily protein [Myxococcota bacterium]|jgi:4'-phosphopantetheinyl transferase|nr:4'-phosphopantetheinyl transferase superfamily protein [Myxococcota bacterium]